jgi:prepilin-type processing-associated H-X9-DG protein
MTRQIQRCTSNGASPLAQGYLRLLGALLLGLLVLVSGCGKKASHSSGDGHEGHSHSHAPKNGGVLIELGDHQYNMELLLDADAGVATVWFLDGHAEEYVRVKQSSFEVDVESNGEARQLSFAAVANPATGETVGESSQFEARAEWLKTTREFTAKLGALEVGGQSYQGLLFHYPGGALEN